MISKEQLDAQPHAYSKEKPVSREPTRAVHMLQVERSKALKNECFWR